MLHMFTTYVLLGEEDIRCKFVAIFSFVLLTIWGID